MTERRTLSTLLCILVGTASITACSGDDGSPSTTAAGSTSSSATSTTSATTSDAATTSASGTGGSGGEGGQGGSGGAEPACGDGVIDAGEECDDGDENGDDKACKSDCTDNVCGDGFSGPGEECDDGNTDDTDGCTNACTLAACGDSIVQPPEECDDGNADDTDTCTSVCLAAACGDGFVQAGEACDDGNADDTDGCTSLCALPTCGDGNVQPPEECDDANADDTDGCTSVCLLPFCGDGFTQAGEECDDANALDTDACTTACLLAACGDGFVQPGEICDDGNMVNDDTCSNACQLPSCGDGIVQAGESCDDGNTDETDTCTTLCKPPACGDGILQPNEGCDDGNVVSGDGCNADCTVGGGVVWNAGYQGSVASVVVKAHSVASDAAGNVYLAGSEFDGLNYNIWVQKLSSAGAVLWTQTYAGAAGGDDEAKDIALDSQGNVIVVGSEDKGLDYDFWIAKYTSAGVQVWVKTYDTAALDDFAEGVALDAQDNIVVAGSAAVAGQGYNISTFKLTSAGSLIWSQGFNGPGNGSDFGFGVAVNKTTGNAFVVGTYTAAGSLDVWLSKYGPNGGAPTWTRTYGNVGTSEFGLGVAVNALAEVIISGLVQTGFYYDGWARKYSNAGTALWTQTYAGAAGGDDSAADVAVDSQGNIVFCGYQSVAGHGLDVWIQKVTTAGTPLWTQTYNGVASLDDYGFGVALDPSDNVLAVGAESKGGLIVDGWMGKYSP